MRSCVGVSLVKIEEGEEDLCDRNCGVDGRRGDLVGRWIIKKKKSRGRYHCAHDTSK